MSLRCIAESSCRAAETASDGTREGALTTSTDSLCEPCLTHITSCVSQLPKDWEELHAALGERGKAGKQKRVRSTPSPAIPISTAKEALMVEIVELVGRAAAVVSDQLHADEPTGRRNTAPAMVMNGKEVRVAEGTPAASAESKVKPDAMQQLRASIAIVEPHIDKLTAAPSEAVSVWDQAGEDTGEPIVRDPDTGEPIKGRGRVFTDQSGLDVALALVDVHNRVRAELGKTRLRHKFGPCPRCGHPTGRDDGTTIVDCRNEACKAAWPEREFHYLQGLILEEHKVNARGWLLDESYQRLDRLQELVEKLANDDRIDLPGAGTIILEQLNTILISGVTDPDGKPIGHQKPKARAIATDLASAKAREVDDWKWSWTNESPYRPPKRKPVKPKTYTGPRIHPASLASEIVEVVDIPGPKCDDCNEIHAGECA
jgi:hypothetical protein